jgi:hypothetical protein
MAQALRHLHRLGLRTGSEVTSSLTCFRNVVRRCDELASPGMEASRGLGAPTVAHRDCRDSTH